MKNEREIPHGKKLKIMGEDSFYFGKMIKKCKWEAPKQ